MQRSIFPKTVLSHVAVLACVAFATPAAAQQRKMTVRVGVTDTTNAPVADADVSVVRGLNDVMAHGVTNAAGLATFTVPVNDDDEIVVRKIGYLRADRFFSPGDRDSIQIHILMHFTAQELAPVKVTASEDLKRKSYYIDADGIEHAPRLIMDGMDILTKLRPDVIGGRSGGGCGVRDIWVNGRRIVYPPVDEMVLQRLRTLHPTGNTRAERAAPNTGLAAIASVLASIKPEHIESFDYQDCFSTKVAGTHASQALFIVLKPGIAFEPGIGSYVIDAPQTIAPLLPAVPLARYRARLLGVYDAVSGNPLGGVDVIDIESGLRSQTTGAGLVTLSYFNEGESKVALHKDGFRDTTFTLKISPADTAPITAVLAHEKPH